MNILMVYPSWEERSALGFDKDLESAKFDRVILFENAAPINSEKISPVIAEIAKKCDDNRILYDKIPLDFNSASSWGVMKDLMDSINSDDSIKLDICTMSRNLIWALLFFLKERVANVDIVYHQPYKYSNEWLSRDAELPRLLFKHSGIVSIEKQTLLVIITGFDLERTKQLVYFYNPSRVILLIQKPNRLDDNTRNTSKLHANECLKMGVKTDVEEIDCYGEDWGYDVIEKVVSENLNNYNIVVSSLGPKLSAVSVYKTFLKHPEIALTYIPCREYNVNYCEGIGNSFKGCIDFKK